MSKRALVSARDLGTPKTANGLAPVGMFIWRRSHPDLWPREPIWDRQRGIAVDVQRRLAAPPAARAGRKALELVANDSEASYLANNERQLEVDRLLIRFSEALKSIPNPTLTQIDSNIAWAGPKGFRDIASRDSMHRPAI